ncbi:MAG: hypothetical protein R6U43_09415 [Candidatus Krumholzibacteriales bacterium]
MSKTPFIILLALIAISPAIPAAGESPEKEINCGELSEILSSKEIRIHYGGLRINPGDTISNDAAVIEGSLDIQSGGALLGNAWIVNGRAVLTGEAYIGGSLNLVNSDKYISRLSIIEGTARTYRGGCELDYEIYREESRIVFNRKDDPSSLNIESSLKPGTPSRVDYNILKVGLKRLNPRHERPYVSFDSHLHIPIWKEDGGFLGFDAEIRFPLLDQKAQFIMRGFKRTETNDDWQLSRLENGVIVALSGNDFADYYETRGIQAAMSVNSFGGLRIKASLSYQRDVSLSARPIPSLFYNHDRFRENPSIDEGDRVSSRLQLMFNTRDETGWTYGGWQANLMFEKGIADGPGDFSYSVMDIDIARFNEISRGLKIDLRGKLFTSFGEIPEQLTMSVNGYGGIRGLSDFPFSPDRGDRMALFTVEIRKSIPELPLLERVCSRMDLLIFSDSGILARAGNPDIPFDFIDDKWKSTGGLGISARSILPCVGFYVAEDLEAEEFSPRFILRAERSF